MANVGDIGWLDLTVEDAPRVRDFYQAVAGWESTDTPMGDYEDYTMSPPAGDPVAGVCHRRGTNASIPAGWMIYIVVDALDARLERCGELGGKIEKPATDMGSHGRYAVIRDPSGACCALFEPA